MPKKAYKNKIIIPRIRFLPQGEGFDTKLAAFGYESIWQAEGQRLIKAYYNLTNLRFWYKKMTVLVVPSYTSEAGRRYRRMRLSAYKFSQEERLRVLSHELAHRLLLGNGIEAYGKTSRFYDHYYIDLFLFDAWVQLYGAETAKQYVEQEQTGLLDAYGHAWKKSLALSFTERQETLRRIISRVPKQHLA
ncbi:MAG TPA: hypothetical protein VJ836_06730 [Candidatus Saccharimonadales bacterium]|nr:hypothetical protein [Candidatus Saccharimonadales bacterium]